MENQLVFTKQASLSGSEKAAILFGELDHSATDAIMKYFTTEEIHKIRKTLKQKNKVGIRNYEAILPTEIKVLEDFVKRRKDRSSIGINPALLDASAYAKLHENDEGKKFLKNLVKNPDAVANVLSVWLKDD